MTDLSEFKISLSASQEHRFVKFKSHTCITHSESQSGCYSIILFSEFVKINGFSAKKEAQSERRLATRLIFSNRRHSHKRKLVKRYCPLGWTVPLFNWRGSLIQRYVQLDTHEDFLGSTLSRTKVWIASLDWITPLSFCLVNIADLNLLISKRTTELKYRQRFPNSHKNCQ